MKVTTRGTYGIKACFELAKHYGQGPQPLKEVAQVQGLSEPYLEQLIAPLRKAQLVQSVRGAHGGYLLARPPAEITVGDILRVLEGSLSPVDSQDYDAASGCQGLEKVLRELWTEVETQCEQVVDNKTLQDLIDDERTGRAYMYYI